MFRQSEMVVLGIMTMRTATGIEEDTIGELLEGHFLLLRTLVICLKL